MTEQESREFEEPEIVSKNNTKSSFTSNATDPVFSMAEERVKEKIVGVGIYYIFLYLIVPFLIFILISAILFFIFPEWLAGIIVFILLLPFIAVLLVFSSLYKSLKKK